MGVWKYHVLMMLNVKMKEHLKLVLLVHLVLLDILEMVLFVMVSKAISFIVIFVSYSQMLTNAGLLAITIALSSVIIL